MEPGSLPLDNIINRLPVEDIIHLCQTNSEYYQVCQDPVLWKRLLKRDYNVEIGPDKDPRKKYLKFRTKYSLNMNLSIADILRSIPHLDNEMVIYSHADGGSFRKLDKHFAFLLAGRGFDFFNVGRELFHFELSHNYPRSYYSEFSFLRTPENNFFIDNLRRMPGAAGSLTIPRS